MKDEAKAAQLWPDNKAMQREWLRAVSVVRSTKRGWVAEDHLKGKTVGSEQKFDLYEDEADIDQDGNRSLEMLSMVILFGAVAICVVAIAIAIYWGL